MKNVKYIYNYSLEECNRLFKKGIYPIGCGVNDNTQSTYHVFYPCRKYFEMLKLVRYEMEEQGT